MERTSMPALWVIEFGEFVIDLHERLLLLGNQSFSDASRLVALYKWLDHLMDDATNRIEVDTTPVCCCVPSGGSKLIIGLLRRLTRRSLRNASDGVRLLFNLTSKLPELRFQRRRTVLLRAIALCQLGDSLLSGAATPWLLCLLAGHFFARYVY
jgi:hypothetical protein